MARFIRLFVAGISLVALTSPADAATEYVKVCSAYGTGFFYVPGTDKCFNVLTGEVRWNTEFGTSILTAPSAPTRPEVDWVPNEDAGCTGGRQVRLTVDASSLVYDADTGKWGVAPVPLVLAHDEFISNVMMSGAFTITVWDILDTDAGGNPIIGPHPLGRGSVCLYYRDSSTGDARALTSLLGCQNTPVLADQSATMSFSPLRSVPPAIFTTPISLFAVQGDENWPTEVSPTEPVVGDIKSFDGTLSISACVRNVHDTSTGGTCDSEAATCDSDAPAVCSAGGTLFTVAVNAPGGATVYAVCSVEPADYGGTAHPARFTCVDDDHDGTPNLYNAAQIATQFGAGFCGAAGAGQ